MTSCMFSFTWQSSEKKSIHEASDADMTNQMLSFCGKIQSVSLKWQGFIAEVVQQFITFYFCFYYMLANVSVIQDNLRNKIFPGEELARSGWF